MIFQVTRLRVKGAILPRFRQALFHPKIGNLQLVDYQDEVCRRWLRRAVLLDDAGREIEGFPALLDASVVHVARDYMTMTGFERLLNPLENRFYDYQQTWYIQPISEETKATTTAPMPAST